MLGLPLASAAWATDIGVNVKFTPAQVAVNSPSTLTIELLSSYPSAISNIAFTHSLPNGLSVSGTPTNSCGGTVALTGSGTSRGLTLTGGAMPAFVSGSPVACSITVNVLSATASNYTDTFAATSVTGQAADNTSVANSQPSVSTLTVIQPIPISGTVQFFSTVALPANTRTDVIRGLDTVYYTLKLTNQNVADITNVTLPKVGIPLVVIADTTAHPVQNGCGGTLNATAGGDGFTLTGGTIPANPSDTNLGGSCTISVPVRVTNPNVCGGGQFGTGYALNAITNAQGIGNSPIQAAPWVMSGVCPSKGVAYTTMDNGTQNKFYVAFANNNAVAYNIGFTDPMPSSGGQTMGVIVSSWGGLYTNGSDPSCGAGMGSVDTSANSATLSGGQVPGAPIGLLNGARPTSGTCNWMINFTGYNDGVWPNTSGTDPITRINQVRAGTLASADGKTTLPYDAFSASVVINPPVGDLGVSKDFSTVSPRQASTVTLNIRVRNYNTAQVLTLGQLQDDLSTMLAVGGADPTDGSGFTFVPGSVKPSPECNASENPTLGAGSNGHVNTLLMVAADTISVKPLTTCVISANVYVSGAIPSGWHGNTIAAKAVTGKLANGTQVVNRFQAQAGVNPAPALKAVTKKFSSPAVDSAGNPLVFAGSPGSTATLTVTVQSYSGTLATSLNVTDNFPTTPFALQVAAVPNASSSCGGTLVATPGGSGFKLTGGNLPAGGTCTISLDVSAPAGATSSVDTNTITDVTLTDTNAPVLNSTAKFTGSVSAKIAASTASPTVSKGFAPSTVTLNAVGISNPSTMTIQVTNAGADNVTLTNVSYADTLPPGMAFGAGAVPVLSGGDPSTCPAGTATIVGNKITVHFDSLTLVKAPCALTVPVVTTVAGSLTNTLAANAIVSDQKLSNPQAASASLISQGTADLYVTKTDNVNHVSVPGGKVQYTIKAGNNGPNAVVNVNVIDTPPTSLAVTDWTCVAANAGDRCPASGSGAVNASVDLAVGGSVTFTVNATIANNAAGPVTNQVVVQSSGAVSDPKPENNSASDTVNVPLDMVASWSNVPTALGPGQAVTGLTLTCANSGPASASNAQCAPSVSSGTISNLVCYIGSDTAKVPLTQPVAASVAAGDAIVCTFDYLAPGTRGGAVTPEQHVQFTGVTGANFDVNADNNKAVANASMVDAVSDALGEIPAAGGATPSVLDNDTVGGVKATTVNVSVSGNGAVTCTPSNAGAPCAALTISADGTITVPANSTPGTYQVPYMICVNPATNPLACDVAVATLTVQRAVTTAVVPTNARGTLLVLGTLLMLMGAVAERRRRKSSLG